MPPELRLAPLLAASFSAALYGGQVIRQVVEDHADLQLINKSTEVFDPQTVRYMYLKITHWISSEPKPMS